MSAEEPPSARRAESPLRLAIHGASGRMGKALQRCVADAEDLVISSLLVRPGGTAVGAAPDIAGLPPYAALSDEAIGAADVVVDFSSAAALDDLVAACERAARPLVCCTTGLGEAQRARLRDAARTLPVVYAANTSVGVQVMKQVLDLAARLLGPAYEVALVETHHRHKRDAPSGTALALEAALRGAGVASVDTHSLRGGDVVGDHVVTFMGPGDRLEIIHRATDRATFAEGALRAARWVAGRPAGCYDMGDVLASPAARP